MSKSESIDFIEMEKQNEAVKSARLKAGLQ